MSQIEDILFAPIHSAVSVDFLYRRSERYTTYDWKPVSDRAIAWTQANYITLYDHANRSDGGWLLRFSITKPPILNSVAHYVRELEQWIYREDI